MATGGGDPLTQLAEDLLSCEVCNEQFHLVNRPPRILHCYHTFCGDCLKKHSKDDRLKCPKCRDVSPAAKVFPVDTTRVALMEWRELVQSQKGVACEGCNEGGKATSKCQDCAEYLCGDCTNAHHRMRVFRSHFLVSLSEAARSPGKLAQKTDKCASHVDEKLKLFCLSCSKAVCGICAVTKHHKDHELVELKAALDDKTKKVLSVCDELEEAQREFQKKAEESESNLRALDTNHREAASRVKDVFSQVVSTAQRREKEELERLDEQVRKERLLLEKQLTDFRSLQAATQAAADYGRRLVSMSIAAEILKEAASLKITAVDLKKNVNQPVAAALTYTVRTEKLEELKALLKSLEVFGRLPDFPDIRLDRRRCHGDCRVSADGCSLVYPSQPPAPQSEERLCILGTCAKAPLPAKACYWQVRCRADPSPERNHFMSFCEVGMACMEKLQEFDIYVDSYSRRDFSAFLSASGDKIEVRIFNPPEMVSYVCTELASVNRHSSLEGTLGFLVQPLKSHVTVIDVNGCQVMKEMPAYIDMSQPLWPCVSVTEKTKAHVRLSIQSGHQVALTPEMENLLRSLVE